MEKRPGSSLSDEVHARLIEMLGSGLFPENARLPSEAELSRRFAVSRPVLRQALARLRAEGRVTSRKGAGTYVSRPAAAAGPSFGPLSSIPDVRSFLEFRCAVEAEAASRAARLAGADGLRAIRQARLRFEEEASAGRPTTDADLAFHMAVAQASGNRFFAATLTALAEQMAFSIRLAREFSIRPAQDRHIDARQEHAAVAAAIEARDAEAARRAMTRHLQGSIQRMFGP